MSNHGLPHQINIWIHIIAGIIAISFAVIILIKTKGNKLHKKLGIIFLTFLAVVILTGLIGSIIIRGNPYLLVLTVLSGYYGFSGFRIIKTKSNIPEKLDIVIAIANLSLGIYFIDYLKSSVMFWNPIVIYSTFGALFIIIAYDFLRYLIPSSRYNNLWLYEHIYKMIAAFTALLAAAVGTFFPNHQPYSQLFPSVIGTLLAIGFVALNYIRNIRKPKT
tara:strand:- start:43 stop:699 length:657 start_codon:yes stop_codon:yes gene_type:complete